LAGASTGSDVLSSAAGAFYIKTKRTRHTVSDGGSPVDQTPTTPPDGGGNKARRSLEPPSAYDAGSLSILRLMCLAGMQLLSLASAVPKWTGVWLILEAGDGSEASPYCGRIYDCAARGTDTSHENDFANDWWSFRGGKEGARKRHEAASVNGGGSEKASDVEGGGVSMLGDLAGKGTKANPASGSRTGGDGLPGGDLPDPDESGGDGEDGSGSGNDAASSASVLYPEQELLSRSSMKAAIDNGLGTETLGKVQLDKVLFMGGLESKSQITCGDVADIFSRAGGVLRERLGKNVRQFSWARACPLSLMRNRWSSPSFSHPVDGSHFAPLNHRSSAGHGIDRKRLAVCVAAHLSPFYAMVFEKHFAAARAKGDKKRLRPKNPFDEAKKVKAMARKRARAEAKSTKPSNGQLIAEAADAKVRQMEANAAAAATAAAAAAARAVTVAENKTAAAPASNGVAAAAPVSVAVAAAVAKATAVDGLGRGPIMHAAPEPLWALERAASRMRMDQVWRRLPVPLLPHSTIASVVLLSGPALSAAARASTKVRVLLSRPKLKEAFDALAAAERTTIGGVPAGHELAVMLTLGEHDAVYVFSSTLMQMSSVLAFNESILSSNTFISWVGEFASSTAHLPAVLNFLTGEPMAVAVMAEEIHTDMAGRLLPDCVWALPGARRGAVTTERQVGAFRGLSANVQDVCDAGQREFLSNATSQSASFTHIVDKEVSMETSLRAVLDVLDSWDSSVTQFVMLVNIGNVHWVSATVSLLPGRVVLYDSSGGSSRAKTHIISRLLLFAHQAEMRWRATQGGALVAVHEWAVDEVNTPRQQDPYNCGLFAFAYIWCYVHGQDLSSLSVVGDQLRLSLIFFVLKCGGARLKKQCT